MHWRMRLRGPAVLAVASLLLLSGERASGSGGTVHIWIGAEAQAYLDDPDLRYFLWSFQDTYYGMGLMFPDTIDSIFLTDHGLNNAPVQAHHSEFLDEYIWRIKSKCGTDPDTWLYDWECARLFAHFLGTLGHVAGDYRFDHYFMTRVDSLCEFNDGGSPADGGSQHFTDWHLDSWVSVWPQVWLIKPFRSAVPVTGCCTSFPGCSPFFCACCSDLDIWPCYSVNCDLMKAIRTAIPEVQSCACGTMQHVLGAVDWHHFVLRVQPFKAVISGPHVAIRCPWAHENLVGSAGGVRDSAEIVADYINKTWEILQAGRTPRYERSRHWPFPRESLAVYELEGDPWRFNFAHWYRVASGVVKYGFWNNDQLAGSFKIVALRADGALYAEEWPPDAATIPLYLAGGVLDFGVGGDRMAILVPNSGGDPTGGELMVNPFPGFPGFPGFWISVAQRVLDFRLEGSRIAVLVAAPDGGKELLVKEGDPEAPWGLTFAGEIEQFELEGDRIGVLVARRAGGRDLLIKQGSLAAPWSSVLSGPIERFQLSRGAAPGHASGGAGAHAPRKVGVLAGGNFLVHEGPLSPPSFIPLHSNVSQFKLAGNLTGVVVGGQLLVQDGEDSPAWRPKGANVSSFELRDAWPGHLVMSVDNITPLKIGKPAEEVMWAEGVPAQGLISQLRIAGPMIGVLVGEDLYVKSEKHLPW